MPSISDSVEKLLLLLQGVKPAGAQKWLAKCPAHPDNKPSLSVARGDDGRALLKCFAGCTCKDICAAIGISEADLFPKEKAKIKPRIVAAYRYCDEAGNLLYEVIRYFPKDFRQRRPDGKGGYIGNMKGVRLVPYRLPELLAADPAVTVFIVEGEKDAERLAHAGLVATCNVGGAGKWKEQYNEPLRGRRVVIIADKDSSGRKHALLVARSVAGIVSRVQILELPGEGVKDANDWLEAGGTVEKLMELVEQAAPFDPQQAQQEPAFNSVEESPWPDPMPLPVGLPPVPPFDIDILPTPLRAWVKDIAERMQCPVDYLAVTAMVAAGALIGRRVAIRPKRHDDWQVVANLFGLCVGRPSLMKSPAMQESLSFLTRLEIEAKEQHAQALAEHEGNKVIVEATRKVNADKLKKAIKEGADPTEIVAAMTRDEGNGPARKRYLVNNTTVEKLGVILNENPNGVLIYCDEVIGFLKALDRDGHEGDRAFYLTAWSGDKRYTYDRIVRGTLDIDAAIVSFIGAIQPGVLHDYLRQAVHGGAGDDGLVQRFQLSVWPDMPEKWFNVDRRPDNQAKQKAYEAFQNLADLMPDNVVAEPDPHDRNALPFLRFDPDAQLCFDQWRQHLENSLRSGVNHPAIEAHLAKYRSLVPSLALIIHLTEHGTGPVPITATQKAIRWAEYLEQHARRLYAGVTEATAVAARELARRILEGEVQDGFVARDVYRNGWTGLDREQTEAAIDVLLSLGWLDERIEETGGRRKTRHAINPKTRESQERKLPELTKAPSVSSVSAGAGEVGSCNEVEGLAQVATGRRRTVRV